MLERREGGEKKLYLFISFDVLKVGRVVVTEAIVTLYEVGKVGNWGLEMVIMMSEVTMLMRTRERERGLTVIERTGGQMPPHWRTSVPRG
jgi:hypothetical protein